MNSTSSPLELLSSPVRVVPGRQRTRLTEVAPETTDEAGIVGVDASLPVS